MLYEAGWLRGRAIYGRDLLANFYPRYTIAGRGLAQGQLPLWNPACGLGATWWGPRAGGVFYPPYLLFAWLSPARAMALFLAFHSALTIDGTRRLGRELGLGARGALAAGLAFAWGGFLASQYWAGPYVVTAATLPWAALAGAWLSDRAQRRARLRGGLILGATAVSVGVWVAEPQGAVCAGGLLLGVAAWRRPTTERWRPLLLAGSALLLGVALAGPQALSLLDELPRTQRALGQWDDGRWDFAPLAAALDLMVPGALGERLAPVGGYWGGSLWADQLPWCRLGVGGLGLGLAGLALRGPGPVGRRRWGRLTPAAQLGLALVGLGLLLAASRVGALAGLRFSAKWLVFVGLGLALLVGAGLDAVRGLDPARRRRAAQALGGYGLLLLLLGALAASAPTAVGEWLAGGDARIEPGPAAFGLRDALLRTGAVASLAALALHWPRVRLPGRPRAWPGDHRTLLLALLAAELLLAGHPEVQHMSSEVLAEPELARRLRRELGRVPPAQAHPAGSGAEGPPPGLEADSWGRAQGRRPGSARSRAANRWERGAWLDTQGLRPNNGYLWGVRTIRPHESVWPRERELLTEDPRFKALPIGARARLLGAQAFLVPADAAPLLAQLPDRQLGLEPGPAAPDLAARLVRLTPPGPWAALLEPPFRQARSLGQARDLLLEAAGGQSPAPPPVLGPHGLAPLPGLGSARPPASPAGGEGLWRLVRYAPELIELEVWTPRPALLVLDEAYDPHWQATISGSSAPVLRVDLLRRGVLVPPGEQRVVLRYAPWWWGQGWTLCTMALLLIIFGYIWIR